MVDNSKIMKERVKTMIEWGEDERGREKMRESEEKREKVRVWCVCGPVFFVLYWSEPNWFIWTGLVHSWTLVCTIRSRVWPSGLIQRSRSLLDDPYPVCVWVWALSPLFPAFLRTFLLFPHFCLVITPPMCQNFVQKLQTNFHEFLIYFFF
jgi:hypothetical protein